uniref:Uncharacterized protein n=1 Tax=Rhizophora mucronata TaxID=61149 RepID=A0A2P2QC69_RHIMU
MADLKYSSSIR